MPNSFSETAAATAVKLPYGRHTIEEEDIQAVVDVLRSAWITQGPTVRQFEEAFAAYAGSRHAVALSSGTAALHAAAHSFELKPGDEVVTSPMTFCATANAVVYQGATPVFADIEEETLLLDPEAVAAAVTSRTKAVFAVDYAGQP